MLTYAMSGRGNLTRYAYLYKCIKEDILEGRIQAGERLPSKRTLAEHLQVSVATVETAYAQLAAEGYLDAREKRGYFVNPVEVRRAAAEAPEPAEEHHQEQNWLLDLKGSGSGTEGFPFSVWARLMRRVLTEEGKQLLQATPHNGALCLRRAIQRHLYQFRGISVSPNQIVVGAGTEYLYNLVVQLLGRERRYGVEDPGYSKAARIYRLNGAGVVPIRVDAQGLVPELVERSGVQVVHSSPNHQFPTGSVMPIARRQSLLRWAAQEEGRYLIEDDYDSEFRFTGLPIQTLKSIDTMERVLYLNTFSRTLAPSLRISYMVLPAPLLKEYRQRLGFYSCTVPAIEQYTLAKFLDEGHFESHVNRMRVYYREQRDAVLAAVRSSALGRRYQVLREEAGLHFLLRLDTERGDRELAEQCEKLGIRLSFLSDYQLEPGSAPSHTLVLHYPGIPAERLPQSLELLAGCI